jgi:cation diffusion facilitator family transporter
LVLQADNYILKKRAALISLGIGIGLFFLKMGGYYVTGSAAIFSDAAESVVHVLATSMALYSIILSSKPADESHPYGHGNIEFFSAGVEGLLIVIASFYIIYKAISDIIIGPELQQLSIGVIVVASAGVINLLLGYYLIRVGKKTNSITITADGKHVLTDSYTSIGVLVGVLLVMFTGLTILDPIFAMAVAVNILITGYKLLRESIGGLMNEMDLRLLNPIVDYLASIKKDYWVDIHELRFWKSGDKIFLDFHLIIPYYFNIKESHSEENEIEALLIEKFPKMQLKIHFDYCTPELCKFCNMQNCIYRTDPKAINIKWDSDKLTGKPVYMIN